MSPLGLGCASLAGIYHSVPDQQARGTIADALDAGLTYVDTAPFYGHGRSERLAGDVLRGKTGITVSTKVGRLLKPGAAPDPGAWVDALPFTPAFDYTYDGIMRSFEASLHRLGLDRVDVLYMHDIGTFTHGPTEGPPLFEIAMSDGYRALDALRSSGTVSAIGLGVNEEKVCMDALDHGDWDVFLLAGRYTLLEQDTLENLLPACAARETDIVIGGPFNSGVLVGGDTFDYVHIPPRIAEKVRALTEVCDAHKVPLPAAALQFPFAHPLVKSVIPGPRSPQELAQILDWWSTDIPAAMWSDLKTHHLLHPNAPTQRERT